MEMGHAVPILLFFAEVFSRTVKLEDQHMMKVSSTLDYNIFRYLAW